MAASRFVGRGYEPVRRFIFRTAGFQKYGLYHDDLLEEYPHVEEALRRLPQDVKDERNFRIIRALHHDMKKIYLPKEQWTTFEDDEAHGRYLQPYIKEVLQEMEEKKEWEKQ